MRKHLLKFLLFSAVMGNSLLVQSQTTTKNTDFFKGSTAIQTFKSGNLLYLASNENDKAVKIICTSDNLGKNWEQTVEGYMQFTGSLDNKVLVVVSTDFTLFTRANSIYKAYVLDAKTGKMLKEKVIFSGNNDYFTYPEVIVAKDRKSFSLITRETSMKRNVKLAPGGLGAIVLAKKMSAENNKIRAFTVTSFNAGLDVTEALSPALPEGDFIGAVKTINNDLYVAVSQEKKGITIAKFDSGQEKASKTITEPFDHSAGTLGIAKLNQFVKLFADTINNNTVYLKGSFKNDDDFICMLHRYDFALMNHKKFSKTFTKADFKAMEKAYTPLNKEFKSLELGRSKDVELLKVLESDNGYLLIMGDVHDVPKTMGSNLPPTFAANGIIVYSVDKDFKLKSVSTVPRRYDQVLYPEISAYYKNGAWYLFLSHDYRANVILAKLNEFSGQLEEIKLIEPNKASKSDLPGLSQLLVTDSHLFLPVMDPKMAFGKTKFDVNLYDIEW